ncbi:hypothetical protein ABK040_006681 [Willaertia magna]
MHRQQPYSRQNKQLSNRLEDEEYLSPSITTSSPTIKKSDNLPITQKYNNNQTTDKKTIKNKKWILIFLILIHLFIFFIFYKEFKNSPNVEWKNTIDPEIDHLTNNLKINDDNVIDEIITKDEINKFILENNENLENKKINNKINLENKYNLVILYIIENENQFDWLKKEYLNKLDILKKMKLQLLIVTCQSFNEIDDNENIKIINFDKNNLFLLTSFGIKYILSQKINYTKYLTILDPGFTIFTNNNLILTPNLEIGENNSDGKYNVIYKKLRIDEFILNNLTNPQQTLQNNFYLNSLFITHVYDSPLDRNHFVNYKFEKHLFEDNNLQTSNNLLWSHRYPNLYSEVFKFRGFGLQKEWENQHYLFSPFNDVTFKDEFKKLPNVLWFFMSLENLQENEILDCKKLWLYLANYLEEYYNNYSYEISFHFINVRKEMTNFLLQNILQQYKLNNKKKKIGPPIYMLPPPYIIEYLQSHDSKNSSELLTDNGFTFSLHSSLDRIYLLNNFMDRIKLIVNNNNNLDIYVVIVFNAKEKDDCINNNELFQFIKRYQSFLTVKCLVNQFQRNSLDVDPMNLNENLRKLGTDYPINILRNEALLLTKTKWVMMLDADFVVSEKLAVDFFKNYVRNTKDLVKDKLELFKDETEYWKRLKINNRMSISEFLENEKIVFVIPAFEASKSLQKLPNNFKELLNNIKRGTISPILQDKVPEAHHNVDYPKYIESSLTKNPKSYRIKSYYPFEPYIIGNLAYLSFYDEDFIYYGNDKVVYHIHLALRYFNYFVLPKHFIVHQYHPSGNWKKEKEEEYKSRVDRKLKMLLRMFYKKLLYWYGFKRVSTFKRENHEILFGN